jgi:hypothetical protein
MIVQFLLYNLSYMNDCRGISHIECEFHIALHSYIILRSTDTVRVLLFLNVESIGYRFFPHELKSTQTISKWYSYSPMILFNGWILHYLLRDDHMILAKRTVFEWYRTKVFHLIIILREYYYRNLWYYRIIPTVHLHFVQRTRLLALLLAQYESRALSNDNKRLNNEDNLKDLIKNSLGSFRPTGTVSEEESCKVLKFLNVL